MLSASARPYIQASVPVLREHGVAITRTFYARLFEAHPELKNVFNMGNQENGAQQGALAAAVFAYAANIDNPAALAPVIARIAHKHASVGIEPAQYPIVGRHLIGAIKQVLGEAATPALLEAWDEAYWLLALALTAAEARLYDRANVAAGALMPLRVTDVHKESEDIVSYCLQTADGHSPGGFLPGQYVSVAVTLPDGLRQLRQYSLCDAPSRNHWRIAVKREAATDATPAGCVSTLLHASIAVGDTLQVSAPFGNFTPQWAGTRPIALLSAGVGITPMIAVLNALVDASSTLPVLFAHAARSPAQYAFRADVAAARATLRALRTHVFYEQPGAPEPGDVTAGPMALTAATIAGFEEADFYLCGPLPFMRAQWRSLVTLGVPPERLQREVFGPELLDHLL
jgi:nitric oxide dioxygenase